jgi:carbon storage regulator
MLVLSRKSGERIVIDNKITIVINRISGNRVTLGIEAPENVHILRGELEAIAKEFGVPEDQAPPISLPIRSAV